jgi:hypothetical protein
MRSRAVGLLALLLASLFGLNASPASAAWLHPSLSEEFGPDGTSSSVFGVGTVTGLVYDQIAERLYVSRPYLTGAGGPPISPQPARGIYGYEASSPGTHTALGGGFPIPLFEPTSNSTSLLVEEAEGTILYADGNNLYSYEADGNALPGNPITVSGGPPEAIDSKGYLWSFVEAAGVLKQSALDGSVVRTVDVSPLKPRSIAIDPRTDDIWTSGFGMGVGSHVLRFTAGSDYKEYDHYLFNRYLGSVAYIQPNGVFWVGRTAYNEDFAPLETLAVPDAKYSLRQIRTDEESGEIYGFLTRETQFTKDNPLYGTIAAYDGVVIPDLRTGPPASVGHTTVTVTGHIDPAGGPGVTGCEIQYLKEKELNEIQTVTIAGATGGTFTLGAPASPDSNPVPYNATAAEVEKILEEHNPPFTVIGHVTVTGPAGGPYRIEFDGEQDLARADLEELVPNDSLTPSGATITVTTDHDGGNGAWEGVAPAPSAASVPCTPSASPGSPVNGPTDVEAELSGLETGVPYLYRLVASNSNGRNVGLQQVVVPQPSLVKTGSATGVTRSTATLNGTVDPEGLSSTYFFEYGKTTGYGSTSSAPPGESVGTTTPGDHPVGYGVAGLEPGTTYHYRLVEVNSKGNSYGIDRTFTTELAVKHLSTEPADPVGRVTATLKGTLDPDGMGTNYYFEYGRTKRYGTQTAAPPGQALADTSPGDQQLAVPIAGLKPETTYHFRLVAENATYGATKGQDRTFTTLPPIKGIETEAATEVEPTEATLHGRLDPDGYDTTFYFEYGKTKFYGHTIAAPPGDDVGTSAPGSVQLVKTLEGLEPGTTYHFRLVGVNETGSGVGADRTFKTPQGPSIEGVFSSDVTASSAKLRGRINPNGTEPSFETTYRFQYGTTTAYGQSVPVGDGTLAPAVGGQNVSVPIEGLSEVTYHFRLVAENQWGKVISEDQTLDFKAPSSCPNTTVRQQTGAAYLPDCRAYELVSPANAGGAVLGPDAPESPFASNRFAYEGGFTAIPGTGDPPNAVGGDLYVANRTTSGWVTRYVGLAGSEAFGQAGNPAEPDTVGLGAIPTDRGLGRFATWRLSGTGGGVGSSTVASYAPYLWDDEGNPLGRLPSNLADVPGADEAPSEGGFTGDAKLSGDGNHYVFSSVGAVFTPGGLLESPGSVYDNDIQTGTVTLVSKTPAEGNIPKDGSAGSAGEYIRIPAVSRDGSHILMSTAAAAPQKIGEIPTLRHLYITVDGAEHYEVSLGEDEVNHGVRFEGMSEDGTQVFFTTAAQMTADDSDESTDIYRWDENGGSPTLERISVGNEGSEGNTDACNPLFAWTTKCDAEVVPTNNRFIVNIRRFHPIDSALAAEGGEAYFYSPEQLEGSRGVPGMRNLYVWRNGTVRHVATLEADGGAERINVSTDGSRMAFVTKTKIGAYENAGQAEMYRYDPAARTLLCVSCRPDGSPPTSDVEGSQNGNFMTEDGRAFFSTEDALVPRDANGIRDVYEYVGGRAQLITTGTGDEDGSASETPIGLVGVSADGTDAFVSTYETLVGQDENGPFLKFYDARVNGGFPFNKPPAPCAAADECHGEGSSSPVAPTIGTGAGLGGGGNVTEAAPRKQAKRRRAQCRRRAQRRQRAGHRRRCHRRREARR